MVRKWKLGACSLSARLSALSQHIVYNLVQLETWNLASRFSLNQTEKLINYKVFYFLQYCHLIRHWIFFPRFSKYLQIENKSLQRGELSNYFKTTKVLMNSHPVERNTIGYTFQNSSIITCYYVILI